MDAIEYSVKQAAVFAANGNAKDAYDLYLSNLGKLVVRLKTSVELSESGLLKAGNADEALYRMVPLCRACISAVERILDAGLVISSTITAQPPALPKARRATATSTTQSALPAAEGRAGLTISPQTSLFSAVLDVQAPQAYRFRVSTAGSAASSSTGVGGGGDEGRASESADLPGAPPLPPPRESVEFSLVEDDSSLRTRSREVSASGRTIDSTDMKADAQYKPWSKDRPSPEIPVSPLNRTYVGLNEKLAMLTSSPAASPDQENEYDKEAVDSFAADEEEANAIRTKIARVLHQIQLVTNPAVSVNCFRPIAIAFQLCVIEHGLLRQVHSNDILVHKNPLPAPSLQACTDFFNYFTRLVEFSILQHANLADRVKTVTRWFKTGMFLRKLNNFQSLKALVGALSTPPIIRLKKTWSQIKRKNGVELSEFEELAEFVSEQNNYSHYRTWIRNNQTRPIVPYLGLVTHDMTYLIAAAKNAGQDPASDKRVQEIQKFIRFCCLGPRYSYEMLFDVEAAGNASSNSSASTLKKGANGKRKLKGGGLSENGIDVLGAVFRDSDEEEIGSFIAHWLLSRKYVSEKEVDEMSLIREPKNPAANKAPQPVPLNDQHTQEDSALRSSKTEDDTAGKSTSALLKLKEPTVPGSMASPGLQKSRAVGSNASFMDTLRDAFVPKQSRADRSGASTPSTSMNTSKRALSNNKQSNDTTLKNSLLRRRQKSLSNIDVNEMVAKSVSMDAGINSSRSISVLDSLATKENEKASSYDSVAGSHIHSLPVGLVEESESVQERRYSGVESEELKRKLELLEKEEQQPRRRSSSSIPAAITSKDTPIKDAAHSASGLHSRHKFFASFFAHNDEVDSQPDESVSPSTGKQISDRLTPDERVDSSNISTFNVSQTPVLSKPSFFSFGGAGSRVPSALIAPSATTATELHVSDVRGSMKTSIHVAERPKTRSRSASNAAGVGVPSAGGTDVGSDLSDAVHSEGDVERASTATVKQGGGVGSMRRVLGRRQSSEAVLSDAQPSSPVSASAATAASTGPSAATWSVGKLLKGGHWLLPIADVDSDAAQASPAAPVAAGSPLQTGAAKLHQPQVAKAGFLNDLPPLPGQQPHQSPQPRNASALTRAATSTAALRSSTPPAIPPKPAQLSNMRLNDSLSSSSLLLAPAVTHTSTVE